MPEKTAKKPAKKAKKKGSQKFPKSTVKKKAKKRKPAGSGEEDRRRADWDRNQRRIVDAIFDLVKEGRGKWPTESQIAEKAGLSRRTITKHGHDMKWNPQKSYMRTLTPEVEKSLFMATRRGSSRAISLWFQIFEGWTPRRDVTSKGKAITGMIAAPGTPEGDAAADYMAYLHDDKL